MFLALKFKYRRKNLKASPALLPLIVMPSFAVQTFFESALLHEMYGFYDNVTFLKESDQPDHQTHFRNNCCPVPNEL